MLERKTFGASLLGIIQKMAKTAFNRAGFDIIRASNNPRRTLLGLRDSSFQTIVDVGANTGQFAKHISSFFPEAKIYCFEPLPTPFEELSRWAKMQNGRVTAVNLALGDKEGEAEMFYHEHHSPSSSLLATTKLNEKYYPFTKIQSRISVKQATLDMALAELKDEFLPEILIKLDVQGYEDRVISGGEKTFKRASACIVEVCLDTLYEGQAGFVNLLTMLNDLGYQYAGNLEQSYGKDGHCVFLDALFLRHDAERRR